MMQTFFSITILFSALRLATPLCFASFGGYFSERSGVVNICLEGMMLIGAFTAAAVAHFTHNPFLGILGGISGALVLAALHAFLSVNLRADQIISGIAINLLALGIPPVVCKALYGMSGGTPSLAALDRLQPIFGASPLVIAVFFSAFIVFLIHRQTRFGQHIRFAGEHPEALQSQGISVRWTRWKGVLLSGFFCGIAGAYLSIDHGSGFSRNMTAGRGFIALAALIIGRWTPQGAFFASLLFGLIETSQILLQGMQLPGGQVVPVQWIQMIPYIATLVILAGLLGKRFGQSRPPLAVGKPLLMIAFLSLSLSGCKPLDEVKSLFSKSAKESLNIGKIPEQEDANRVHGEFLKELYPVVLQREIQEEEFTRLLNVLDQGAHYDGVYNGIVYSAEYRAKEQGKTTAAAMRTYADLMTFFWTEQKTDLLNQKNDEEKPDVPKPQESVAPLRKPTPDEIAAVKKKFSEEALQYAGFELKRVVGEELLKTLDLKRAYREKLAAWYGRFAAETSGKALDLGLPERNNKDEYYHYKWALDASEDRIKWESLNRIHRLLNAVL